MLEEAMPPDHCDVLIAGGGLSGLLLAAGLADEKYAGLHVCVVEPRLSYVRDRTWSYWRQEPHMLSHLERCTWRHWSVAHVGRELRCAAASWVYASVDADAVYAHALKKIQSSTHVRLLQGWAAHSLTPSAQLRHAGTGRMASVQAKRVVDATAQAPVRSNDLVQQFVGWEVRCEEAVFKPETVQLMHFQQASDGLHFMYALPYDVHNALIESTWVSPAQHQPNFEAEMHNAVSQRLGAARYEITYQERGRLPLITPAQPRDGLIRLGQSGAALRPSTGYAFLNTLAQVQRLLDLFPTQALALAAWHAPQPPQLAAQRWMDEVFLRELQSNWQAAPERFMALFAQVPPDALMRFLSGQEGWADRWAVMRALPMMPYVKAALQHSMGNSSHA